MVLKKRGGIKEVLWRKVLTRGRTAKLIEPNWEGPMLLQIHNISLVSSKAFSFAKMTKQKIPRVTTSYTTPISSQNINKRCLQLEILDVSSGKLNGSTSFTIEALGNTFNLHSNSTNAQEVWILNWLQRENLRVTYIHIHHFTMILHLH